MYENLVHPIIFYLEKNGSTLIGLVNICRKRKNLPTDEPPNKKSKKEADEDRLKAEKEKEIIKRQNKKIFYYRDQLERALKKNELQDILESNGQEVPTGVDSVSHLARM